MKTKLLLLALFICPFTVLGQSTYTPPSKPELRTDYVKNTNVLIQVLDSMYSYDYVTGAWEAVYKRCIQSRHWGTNGLPNEWHMSVFNKSLNDFELKVYEHYTYQNDTAEDVKEYLVKSYNTNINDWNSDSMYYYNLTGYYNSQFNEVVFRDVFISKGYDYTTNNYLYGSMARFTLKDDSLYDQVLSYGLNTASNQWVASARTKYEYNANNYLQKRLNQNWSVADEAFINDNQSFYIFQNGKMTQRVDQSWNGSSWENFIKVNNEFGTANELLSETDYTWDGVNSVWLPTYRTTFTYTTGLVTMRYVEQWDDMLDMWVEFRRTGYGYNASSLITLQTTENWTGTSWQYDSRYTYSYNSNDQTTLELEEEWDAVSSSWVNVYKYSYTYDGNNNLSGYLEQNWDDVSSAWRNFLKDEYTYDSNDNNTVYTNSDWDTGTNSWLYDYKLEFYYSQFDATSVNDIVGSSFGIYPNPSNGLISIDMRGNSFISITITDATGRVVIQDNEGHIAPLIDLHQYGAGMYIITMKDDTGKIQTGKIIVQ